MLCTSVLERRRAGRGMVGSPTPLAPKSWSESEICLILAEMAAPAWEPARGAAGGSGSLEEETPESARRLDQRALVFASRLCALAHILPPGQPYDPAAILPSRSLAPLSS